MGDHTERLQFNAVARESSNCVCADPPLDELRGEPNYGGWKFHRCVNCGILVLNPRLNLSALATFYKTTYDYASKSNTFDILVGQLEHNPWVKLKFNSLLPQIRFMAPRRKLLDFSRVMPLGSEICWIARKWSDS